MTEIRIYPAEGTWVVRAEGAVIGETRNALELVEGEHPFVIYFPRGDIAMAFLEPSDQGGECPQRGPATRFHITSPGGRMENAAYSYETPPEAMSQIAGHIAFDAAKVTVERV